MLTVWIKETVGRNYNAYKHYVSMLEIKGWQCLVHSLNLLRKTKHLKSKS